MKNIMYKRLSIAVGAGAVLAVSQVAETLSEALEQEMAYYQRASRIPAEIDIEKEEK